MMGRRSGFGHGYRQGYNLRDFKPRASKNVNMLRMWLFSAFVVAVVFVPRYCFAAVSTNLPFIERLSEVYDILTGPIVVWLAVGTVIAAGFMFFTARWFEAFGFVAKMLIGVAFITGAVAYVGAEYGQSISALIPF